MHSKPQLLESAPWESLRRLRQFCEDRGITEIEVAFGWLLSHPEVSSVIAGATRPEQVRQNAAAASWSPSPAELAELNEMFPPPRRVSPF